MRNIFVRLSDLEKSQLNKAKELLLQKGTESLPKAIQDELENKKVKYLKGDTSYGAIIEVCTTIFKYLMNLIYDGNKRSGDASYEIDETPRLINQLEGINGNLYDIIIKGGMYICPICKKILMALNPFQHDPDFYFFRCNNCGNDFKIENKPSKEFKLII